MKKKKNKIKLPPEKRLLDLRDLEGSVKELKICPDHPLHMSTNVAQRLKKNIETLRTLEKEWEDADRERKERNKQLEAEGHETLEQKIKALHDKLAKEQKILPS